VGDFDSLLRQVIAGEQVGYRGWDDFANAIRAYRAFKDDDRDTALDLASGDGVMTQALHRYFARLAGTPAAGR
jgi:hypothetical protein